MSRPLHDSEDFTPEQRRLLGMAYRLILNWPRREHQIARTQPGENNASHTHIPKANNSSPAKGGKQDA